MNASSTQALCQPSLRLARSPAKTTVNLPAGPSFLHATETVAQLGPESALLLVRTIAMLKQSIVKIQSNHESSDNVFDSCPVTARLKLNMSVDLDAYFNVGWQ